MVKLIADVVMSELYAAGYHVDGRRVCPPEQAACTVWKVSDWRISFHFYDDHVVLDRHGGSVDLPLVRIDYADPLFLNRILNITGSVDLPLVRIDYQRLL